LPIPEGNKFPIDRPSGVMIRPFGIEPSYPICSSILSIDRQNVGGLSTGRNIIDGLELRQIVVKIPPIFRFTKFE
jgi:hypothetical protein